MPTNEERREVAARLRLLPDQRGIYSDRQFFELLDEKIFCLLDKALDNPRGFHTWVSNIFYLADLIEPEPERTCQIVNKYEGTASTHLRILGHCSKCGEVIEVTHKFCFECGAKVVDK